MRFWKLTYPDGIIIDQPIAIGSHSTALVFQRRGSPADTISGHAANSTLSSIDFDEIDNLLSTPVYETLWKIYGRLIRKEGSLPVSTPHPCNIFPPFVHDIFLPKDYDEHAIVLFWAVASSFRQIKGTAQRTVFRDYPDLLSYEEHVATIIFLYSLIISNEAHRYDIWYSTWQKDMTKKTNTKFTTRCKQQQIKNTNS